MNEGKIQRRGKLSAAEVFEAELEEIQKLRKDASETNLIGLAFSGGGIRSATLNLGVLQMLAKRRLLAKFDYLSTVSGGGYIGAFLTSMLRHADADMDKAQAKLDGSWVDATRLNAKFTEINFLRQYSNYLTPKLGFSSDTMAALGVWLTNTLLNQLVLGSAIATIAALALMTNGLLNTYIKQMGTPTLAAIGLVLSLLAFVIAVSESLELSNNFSRASREEPTQARPTSWGWILTLGWLGVLLMGLGVCNLTDGVLSRMDTRFEEWLTFDGGEGVSTKINTFWLVVTALVGMVSLGIIAMLGAVGRGFIVYITSFCREWWARLGGLSISWCAAWLAALFLFLYLPLRLDAWLAFHPLTSISAWGVATSAAVLLGKSAATGGDNMQKIKEKLTIFLPWLVIAGMMVLISFGVHRFAVWLSTGGVEALPKFGQYGLALAEWFKGKDMLAWKNYALLALFFAAICAFFAWRVDVNIFSLHYFYRNRLTRCYLGATNPKRNPSAFTGFDPKDDVDFADCLHRPLHIVNTALNLTSSANLAWQQRMAASFAFTPLYAGFEFPDGSGGYRQSRYYTRSKGVQLGSIISVSGAAASPNMGYHSAPAAAFLMTMFNARLGRWYGNPATKGDCWKKGSPSFGLGYLAKELFARADIGSDYVYLSDGGHFENLGIYELVRRKCKLIIAIDAGADGDYHFEDIGNAIRKCEVDLNVTITLPLADIHPTVNSAYSATKFSKKHHALGTIRYDGDHRHDGILLYIKSSLTGDEPSDLINFKLEQPAFPHHSTVDQFFNESQFESYRNLGLTITEDVLRELAESTDEKAKATLKMLGIGAEKKRPTRPEN